MATKATPNKGKTSTKSKSDGRVGLNKLVATQQNKNSKSKPRDKDAAVVAKATQKYNVRLNRYLMTLIDPFYYRGDKVPDINTWPSVAFDVEEKFTLATDANGRASFLVYPSFKNFIFKGLPYTFNLYNDLTNYTAIAAAYMLYRPVSMGIEVRYVGTTLNASGQLGCFYWVWADPLGVPTSFNDLSRRKTSVLGPLTDGIDAIWKPFDNRAFQYYKYDYEFAPYIPASRTGSTTSLGSVAPVDSAIPGVVLAVEGGPASETCLQVSIVINFEAIPATATWSPSAPETSSSNPTHLAVAQNVIHQIPAAMAPTSKGSGFMGMLKEALPIAKDVVKEIVPLIKAII